MVRHDLSTSKKYCWGSLGAVQKAVIIIHLLFLSSEIFRLNLLCCVFALTDFLLIKLVEIAAQVDIRMLFSFMGPVCDISVWIWVL